MVTLNVQLANLDTLCLVQSALNAIQPVLLVLQTQSANHVKMAIILMEILALLAQLVVRFVEMPLPVLHAQKITT